MFANRKGKGRPSGVSAVIVVLLLAVIGGFCALVVNIGHLMSVRGELQNACDSAALAGAQELDGQADSFTRARAKAVEFAGLHATDRVSVTIDPYADVILGHWSVGTNVFTEVSESDPDALQRINAVRVLAGRTVARGNPLNVFLAAFNNGMEKADATAQATAACGGPCESGCSVPLVFADCVIKIDGDLQCDKELVLRSDTTDNIGFTNLLDGIRSVNTAGIIATLSGTCRPVSEGDQIGVSNGNNLNNNVVKAFEDYMARNGPTVTVPIVTPPSGCPAKFTGLLPVESFATFTITQVEGPPTPAVHMQLDCNRTSSEKVKTGCEYFGTVTPKAALVQ